jgi:uncharacterized membrane-anchored protein YitT (DUF2179 family)
LLVSGEFSKWNPGLAEDDWKIFHCLIHHDWGIYWLFFNIPLVIFHWSIRHLFLMVPASANPKSFSVKRILFLQHSKEWDTIFGGHRFVHPLVS